MGEDGGGVGLGGIVGGRGEVWGGIGDVVGKRYICGVCLFLQVRLHGCVEFHCCVELSLLLKISDSR